MYDESSRCRRVTVSNRKFSCNYMYLHNRLIMFYLGNTKPLIIIVLEVLVKGYNEGSLNVVTILHTDRPSPFILLEM